MEQDTKKGNRIKIFRKETYGMTQNITSKLVFKDIMKSKGMEKIEKE
jgi:hypothetical protein